MSTLIVPLPLSTRGSAVDEEEDEEEDEDDEDEDIPEFAIAFTS